MMLINAFSANMLAVFPANVVFSEITAEEARLQLLLSAEAQGEGDVIRSAVGHQATADLFSQVLGVPVECRRETVSLGIGDWAILGQYSGPRLAEGATELPEGATIKWLWVNVCRVYSM